MKKNILSLILLLLGAWLIPQLYYSWGEINDLKIKTTWAKYEVNGMRNFVIGGIAEKVHNKEECLKLADASQPDGMSILLASMTECYNKRVCPGLLDPKTQKPLCYSYTKVKFIGSK